MRRTLTLLLVLALIASACSGDDGGDDAVPADDDPVPGDDTTPGVVSANGQAGLVSVSLSEGSPSAGSGSVDVAAVVEGEPLDAAAIVDVVDRLPEWDAAAGEQQDFNRPAESIRPPVAGETIDQPFPIDGDEPPPAVDNGPLEVLRVQPEGDVGLAPFVSVTFNQPMIALGTVEQSDANDIPVVMTPELPGRWQWIGTRTLRFEHDPEIFDRLPMATTYTVEIPAGTASASGNELAETVQFDFETPSPTMRWLTPSGESLDLEPLFVAAFDQRIVAEDVLTITRLEVEGSEVAVRLATDDEIEADSSAAAVVDREVEGTTMVFRAEQPLATDSAISIEIGPNVPSAEGPNTSDETFEGSARTYAPLAIREHSCREADPCQPEWGFSIRFNNQLDGDSIEASDIVIEPAIPGAFIRIDGNWIGVEGTLVGETVYDVTVPAELTDTFGQTLGEDETVQIHVGAATPFLDPRDDLLVTLDPLVDTQTLPLTLRNHDEVRVRAFEVTPDEWGIYELFAQLRYQEDPLDPRWPELYDEVVATGAPANQDFEARIDLEPIFGGEPGMAVVIIDPVGELANLSQNDDRWYQNRPVVRWVQSTSIGADLVNDDERGIAWATDLRTGEPLDGVDIRLVGNQETVETDAQGLAEFALPSPDAGPLVATLGDDTAITLARVEASAPTNRSLWYVVDDRALYRPGETIRVKGWARTLDLEGDATLEFWPSGETITYVVRDGFGNEIGTGETTLTDQGGFDIEAELPLGANLGDGWIDFARPSTPRRNGWTHSFRIEEFRRPEFEVTARAETEGPYVVSDPATIAVDATYFSGGPLPEAPVDWWVVTRPTSYSPPGWAEFTFGSWTPWWFYDDFGGLEDQTSSESFSGVTDAEGSHYLQMNFGGDGEGRPTTVSATASVQDVNRQTWSSTTDLLVHSGERYAGLRSTRPFVREGDGLDVEVIVTDIDGSAVADVPVTVSAERIRQNWVDGEWTDVVLDSESCATTSTSEPVVCSFALDNGGRWTLSAEVADEAGRTSLSEMTVWVTGGDAVPSRRLERQDATLVPDQADYAVGDTAEIFVGSPFGPAHGLMTVSRNGIDDVVPFEIEGSDTVLTIDIDESDVPNLEISVELVGTAERAADDGTVLPDVPPRPAYATGRLGLRVPPATRTLDVAVDPAADAVEPGSSTSVTVDVADATGAPVVGAEVLVVAVDEAVLALTGYELTDPLEVFYGPIDARTAQRLGRETIRLADPAALLEYLAGLEEQTEATLEASEESDTLAPAEAGRFRSADGFDEMSDDSDAAFDNEGASLNLAYTQAGTGGGSNAAPIEVRQNFDALALWAPQVATGSDGSATVEIDVPDSLTRYRIMAIAVDGADRFGSAESNLTARLPLQVRPSAPRFLNFGDDFELPIVIQNLEDTDVEVDVVLQTSNLTIEGSAGRSVTVPANNRVEVRFPVTTESAGTGAFRAVAVSGDHADAAIVTLPIYTPATAEAFATYGVVDSGATVQPFEAPEGVLPQFGGLEVTTSSTAVQALTDAMLYLVDYPYQSADGHASRILAIAALRDVLEAFAVEGIPTPAEFDAAVATDVAALASLQSGNGGWPVWRFGGRVSPYRSVHVMHALIEAEANGYDVPEQVLERGRSFLRNVEDYIPQEWSPQYRDTLVSYSLFVRRLDGDVDSAKARTIWNRYGTDFGFDGIAWLWPVVEDAGIEAAIARHVSNAVTETPAAATFTTSYGEEGYLLLHSDRRTDGIVLDALLLMDPQSDLIPKVVTGLIGNQRQGRWNNAQENAFILLALNNYFDTFEAVDPDFVARVWLGDLYAAEHEFSGRSTDSIETVVPMAELLDIGDDDLVLSKEGDGRLYYRLGLRYAPDDFDLDPLDRGFVVQRTYTAVDDPDDVAQDADGTWRIRAGARVRVELTMVNDSRRTNMALIDPLPAGFEAENPALATTAPAPPSEDFGFEDDFGADFGNDFDSAVSFDIGRSWWWGSWYDHENLRDDRVEAFSAYLWAGTHQYDYIARATTPGTFVVPPTRAEEIYSPEVFGRAGSEIVVVE